jgi:hypothetical protein
MVVYQCPHCGQSFTPSPHRLPAPKLYTPTMNGFERFLWAMIGLKAGPVIEGEAMKAT